VLHRTLQSIALKHNFSRDGLVRYAKNTGWIFFGKFGNLAISFFATLYIARSLGPANFGELSYALSFLAIFSFIASLGIDSVLYRELIKEPEKKHILLGTALRIKLIAASVTSLLTITAAWLFSPPDVSFLIIAIMSTSFVFQVFGIINYEFGAAVNNKPISILSFFVTAVINILKIIVIFLGKGVLYLAIIFVFEVLLYAIGYIYLRSKVFGSIRQWKYENETAKKLLIDSWPFIFTTAFATLYARIDQVMLKNIVDATAVGIYDVAVRLSELWYFLPAVFVGSLFPAIINAQKSLHRHYRQRVISLTLGLLFLSGIIALFMTLFAEPIVLLIYGSAFAPAIPILQLYIWAFIPISLSIVLQQYLLAENAKITLFTMSFVGAMVNIGGNTLLIPTYGALGAAIATLISSSSVVLTVIALLLIRRHFTKPII
jgi:O-antigen/teichoic acid export membrane protein